MAKKPMPPKEEVWVYPTGEPEADHDHPVLGHEAIGASGGPLPITEDAYNIQMAVLENPGKRIVLKAHNENDQAVDFVLGLTPAQEEYLTQYPGSSIAPNNEPGICLLLKDVIDTELVGETVNGRTTTLKGGKFLFYSPLSEASISSYGYYYLYPDEHKNPEGQDKGTVRVSDMIIKDAWGDVFEFFATEGPVPGDESEEYDVPCDVSVTNIRFENITIPAYQWRAMFVANAGDAVISDCYFDINTYDVWGWAHALMLATTNVTVARNNHIKVGPAHFGSYGIGLALTREGSMTYVNDNTIESANIGIWMENNNRGVYDISNNHINAWNCGFGGGNAEGFTFGSMKHNDIHLMPEEEPYQLAYTTRLFVSSVYIDEVLGNPYSYCPVLDPYSGSPFELERYGDTFEPFPTGIIGVSTGWSGLFGFQSYLSKALVEGNRFSGTMNRGVYLGFEAHDNIFKANNMNDVNFIEVEVEEEIMPPVTYWFDEDTYNNKVVGNTGGVDWVSDLSQPGANRFTGPGFRGIGPGFGQLNSSIMEALNAKFAGIMGSMKDNAALINSLKRSGMKVD
jgi:hypothetical protein